MGYYADYELRFYEANSAGDPYFGIYCSALPDANKLRGDATAIAYLRDANGKVISYEAGT